MQPLMFIGGPYELVTPLSFYLPQHPRPYYLHDLDANYRQHAFFLAPWATKENILRHGVAVACPSRDSSCLAAMHKVLGLGPHATPREVPVTRRWLGIEGPSDSFTIAILKPSEVPIESVARPQRKCAFGACTFQWIRDRVLESIGALEAQPLALDLSSRMDWPTFIAVADVAGLHQSFEVKLAIDELNRIDGDRVRIAGWAADVAGRGTPLEIVIFGQGTNLYHTQTAGERSDVTQALNLPPSGRNVAFGGTFNCLPGERLIIVAVAHSKRFSFTSSFRCP